VVQRSCSSAPGCPVRCGWRMRPGRQGSGSRGRSRRSAPSRSTAAWPGCATARSTGGHGPPPALVGIRDRHHRALCASPQRAPAASVAAKSRPSGCASQKPNAERRAPHMPWDPLMVSAPALSRMRGSAAVPARRSLGTTTSRPPARAGPTALVHLRKAAVTPPLSRSMALVVFGDDQAFGLACSRTVESRATRRSFSSPIAATWRGLSWCGARTASSTTSPLTRTSGAGARGRASSSKVSARSEPRSETASSVRA